jgi:hypothetical protein
MADVGHRFSYPRPNLIVSSDGFSVEVRGRDTLRYVEADKKVDLFAEQLGGDEPAIIVRRGDVRAWQTSQGESPVSDAERLRILANIRDAFSWKGWKFLVE